MAKTKIGLIQVMQRAEDDYKARCDMLYSQAEKCFIEGAELVFFPEAFQHVPDRSIVKDHDRLSAVSAEWKQRCSALAKKYHAYLVPWDYEYADGKVYNSSYILDRDGNEIGRYRKVHLTHSEQMRGLSNGEDFPVFDLDIGKIGIMICWDNYFPESARCLGNNGAELVLYPLYGDTLIPQWEIKLRARAIDNVMHIACTQIDENNDVAFTGIVAPDGEIIERFREPSYKVVEIDIGKPWITHTTGFAAYSENIKQMTERCRRPQTYGAIYNAPKVESWEDIFYGNEPIVK